MPSDVGAPPARRFGDRLGCFVVALALAVVAAGVVWSVKQPRVGVPVLLLALAGCALLLRHANKREKEERERETARLTRIASPSGDAWRRLLEAEGLGAHVATLAAEARPALRLTTVPAVGDLPLGASRIGGDPDVPAGFEWPLWRGQPLAFLAQLDLAEVGRLLPGSPLPDVGHLLFFYVADQRTWGSDAKDRGSSHVAYLPGGAPLASQAAPEKIRAARRPACSLRLDAYKDLPDLEDHPLAARLSEPESERYLEVRSFLGCGGDPGGASHKLFGHPQPIQGAMEEECLVAGPGEWRLLLQLDSDDRAKMMWGDAGMLYFWMRQEDLAQRGFDQAWLILQCH